MVAPALLLSISILVLSQAAVLVKWAHASVDSIGFWRLALAIPVLFVLSAKKVRLRELKRIPFNTLILCGVLLFAHWRLWFMAVQKTTVANATICFALNPVLTAVGALVFFKEPITFRVLLAMSFGLTGVLVMEWNQLGTGNSEGDFLGLLSMVCFSGYVLASKGILKSISNELMTLLLYSISALGFLALLLVQGENMISYPEHTWWAFIGLAVGPTLLGHALFTYCLNHLNVNLMSCATLFEPVFAALAAYWLFNENLYPSTIVAFILVCAGVLSLYWESLIRINLRPTKS